MSLVGFHRLRESGVPNFFPVLLRLKPWVAAIARIRPLYLEGGQFLDNEKKKVAVLGQVDTGEEQQNLAALLGQAEVVVMDALDWQVCMCLEPSYS
jgi:hypothetical protein